MSRFALIGQKLDYSFSKMIHEGIFDDLGTQDTYDLIEIKAEAFDKEIESVFETYDGFNVTMPYKERIIPFLDEVDERAKAIGAVNTVAIKSGRRIGYNTDYEGIEYTLDQLPTCHKAIVLGTGGASKAVINCLYDRGFSKVYQVSRQVHQNQVGLENAPEVMKKPALISYEDLAQMVDSKALLVNCTPVGMSHIPTPLKLTDETIKGLIGVFDLVYNPLETFLLQKSKQFERPCKNGLDMLIYQAIAAENKWRNLQKYNYNKLLVAIKEQIMIKIK